MTPEISLFALAENSIIEKDTNKTTLIGIFNFYKFQSVPTIIPGFLCYIRLFNIQSANRIVITLNNPDGSVNNEVVYDSIVIPRGDNALNIATYFSNISVSSFGKYQIIVRVDGNEIANTPEQWLNVIQNEA